MLLLGNEFFVDVLLDSFDLLLMRCRRRRASFARTSVEVRLITEENKRERTCSFR